MNRKWLACFLAGAMLLAALGGCGTQQDTVSSELPDSSETSSSEVSSQEEVSSAAPVSEGQEAWSTLVSVDWEENSMDLDTGIKMTYLTCGPEDGIPLLLIHGATDSRISWSQVAPKLADAGFRCYIPELRGHGKTDKPEAGEEGYTAEMHCADVLNLMDKLEVEKFIPVGHSLGSLIAQEIMITAPERVERGVLISSSTKMGGNPTLDWILQGDGTDFLGVRGYDEEQKIPDDFIKSWTETTNEDENFCKAIYEHASSLPYADWYNIFGGCSTFDSTDRLSSVTCPVDIIWGSADVFFSQEDEEQLQKALSNAEVNFCPIEGASHNIHWDSAETCEAVASEIIRFAGESTL